MINKLSEINLAMCCPDQIIGNTSPKRALHYVEDVRTGEIQIPKHIQTKLKKRIRTKAQYVEEILRLWIKSELDDIRRKARDLIEQQAKENISNSPTQRIRRNI